MEGEYPTRDKRVELWGSEDVGERYRGRGSQGLRGLNGVGSFEEPRFRGGDLDGDEPVERTHGNF